jgi:flagellar protein FliO/FliZ
MQSYIFWTFILALLALASAAIAIFVRAYLSGTTASALLFRPKAERRLEVVDYANVDSRRKLVLIRRDDVEHLLMTGGPVDVVIETGIAASQKRVADVAPVRPPSVVRRQPMFGRSAEPADPDAGPPQL